MGSRCQDGFGCSAFPAFGWAQARAARLLACHQCSCQIALPHTNSCPGISPSVRTLPCWAPSPSTLHRTCPFSHRRKGARGRVSAEEMTAIIESGGKNNNSRLRPDQVRAGTGGCGLQGRAQLLAGRPRPAATSLPHPASLRPTRQAQCRHTTRQSLRVQQHVESSGVHGLATALPIATPAWRVRLRKAHCSRPPRTVLTPAD